MSELAAQNCVMGTRDLNLGVSILSQALRAWYPKDINPEELLTSFFEETEPRSPLEAMLISQMAAAHSHAMEMFIQAKKSMSPDTAIAQLKIAERLIKTFANSLDVLERSRRKGHQSVKVEHVHINAGGQAIVGNVNQGGSSK